MQNRILELRKDRGLTLSDLAKKIDSTAQQVGRLEKGERKLTTDWMEKIAFALDVLPEDLMSPVHGDRIVIPEIALEILPKHHDDLTENDVIAEWSLPKQLLDNQVRSNKTLRIIKVRGDSMEPEFNPGDRIMVDLSDKTPSPAGVFVISDGLGYALKRCEVIAQSKPPRMTISSTNQNYSSLEAAVSEIEIFARVVGKWQWT